MKTSTVSVLTVLSSLLAAHVFGAVAQPAATGQPSAPAPREAVVIYYDAAEPAIAFSAEELQKTLRSLGHDPATLKPLAELPDSPEPCYIVIAKKTALPVLKLLENRGGRITGVMGEQAYALRSTKNNGNRGYWAIGGDRLGAMYGGIHIGEIEAAGAITDLADGENAPYIANRGIKFNIPLDKRQPSFDDNGTSGHGMCPNEHFGEFNKDHDFKEQWCFDVYGEGILDYKKTNPQREIGFIHRYWLTDFKYIGHRFEKLPDGYDLEYKYSRARLYSAPNPPFVKKDILDATPANMKTWWNLRNDDIFLVRWGDPEYVKQAVLHFPGNGRTAGYVLGSDRFCWGRESASKTPSSPRQLENEKHWYSFLLWGRLSYDPETSPELLKGLIGNRLKTTQGAKLYETWQAASQIIPLVNRTRYVPWDYMWWVEGCRGHLLDESIRGFHTVNIFLDKRWGGMDGTDHIGIHQFVVEGKTSGITPLASADQIGALAEQALRGAAEISDGGNAELRETLGDIRTQARLGQYYAAKIRGAVSVGLFRKTGEAKHQTEAVAHLEKALTAWHDYAKELDANYTNMLYISGQRTFDWFDDSGPKSDIEIAKKGNS